MKRYTTQENTAMIFAARYVHNRNTGGTLAIVDCLIKNWHKIDKASKIQILREADNGSTTNRDDWRRLFDHANYTSTNETK
jgi:hypothetical protein